MRNFQKKKGWGDIMQSKPVLFVLGILILVFSWSILGFWHKKQDTEKNKEIVAARVAELKQQKEKLSADIESLKTDAGKEKVFRENFGLAKEGESLIVVVDDKNKIEPPEDDSSPFFSFFKNLFK